MKHKPESYRRSAMAALATLSSPDAMRPIWLSELKSDVMRYISALEQVIAERAADKARIAELEAALKACIPQLHKNFSCSDKDKAFKGAVAALAQKEQPHD